MLQWQNLGGIMFHIFTLTTWTVNRVNDVAEHQSPCITCTGDKCDQMWHVLTTCDKFDHMWQVWPHATSLTTCNKFDHMWPE